MNINKKQIRCELCTARIFSGSEVYLELSLTNGNYYKEIPVGHESQGGFPFGKTCATAELIRTYPKPEKDGIDTTYPDGTKLTGTWADRLKKWKQLIKI